MGGAFRFVTLLTTPFSPVFHRPTSFIFHRLLTRRISTTTSRHIRLSSLATNCHGSHTAAFLTAINSSRKGLHAQAFDSDNETTYSTHKPTIIHPWPEWSHLLDNLLSSQGNQFPGTSDQGISPEDAFVVYEEKQLSDQFIHHASVCLAFSRSRPELLSFLSRKDIEVIALNGTPFLFKSALGISRRMRAYLGMEEGNVLEQNKVTLVDIMKYMLSYASNPSVSSERNSLYSRELVESSVRNLLQQIAEACFGSPTQNLPTEDQICGGNEQTLRPLRQNVEMKRGDWICAKCSFMNFARNFTCLECEEPRANKQLTGREWQCPQCNFYNYGRNLVCLRCDCKRPGAAVTNNVHSVSELGSINIGLSENEEKAKCWFDEVSQLDNAAHLSGATVHEDFPEITPLRKGENASFVSTRKTHLEGRQANNHSRKGMGEYGTSEGDICESSGPYNAYDSSIRQSLDHIRGDSPPVSRISDPTTMQVNVQTDTSASLPRSSLSENEQPQDMNSSSVPSVPFSRDLVSTQDDKLKPKVGKNLKSDSYDMAAGASPLNVTKNAAGDANFVRKSESNSKNEDNKQAEKSEKWFQRVAELHNVKDLPSAISEEEFPDIMPMRKGENRFVVSKKKDRSLTSPAYKRHAATGQASNSNFVPFVPFPPGYFARKDTLSADGNLSTKSSTETSPSSSLAEDFPKKLDDDSPRVTENNAVQQTEIRSSGDWSPNFSGRQWTSLGGNTSQNSVTSPTIESELGTSGHSREENASQSTNQTGGRLQLPNQNASLGWTGKSLEGSAVKEPDYLDMSEEAKAERWFRRVAQIKDISELSKIPDEDFPSIMPMRKGVNRFVVSKRKTPLERRLTSPQYRRNLPMVSSDTINKANDNK